MPCLSNGHLGFTVFGDSIYVNGVYNGRGGDSRRARLPNWLNLSAQLVQVDDYSSLWANVDINYELNLYQGYFQSMLTVHVPGDVASNSTPSIILKQRLYAHRFFNRALIYELFVERMPNITGKPK